MHRTTLAVYLALAATQGAYGATYYIAPNGADRNPGTLASPWRSIGKAIRHLAAGDTLYLRGGTYVERVEAGRIHAGTPESPITLAAYPGERPVIQGVLSLHDPSYWIVDGLTVTWDPGTGHPDEHMVKMTNGIGWVVRRCEFWGSHCYACLLVAGTRPGEPAGWRVTESAIHDALPANDTNQDHLIYVNTGLASGPGLVDHNLLWNAPNGEAVKLAGAGLAQGSAHVTVAYNTIYQAAQGILVGGLSHDNTIHHNIFDGIAGTYGAIRGYRLAGAANVAYANLVSRAGSVLLNDRGYAGVADGGGNLFPIDPQWDSVGPAGFHPANEQAAEYGRYAEAGARYPSHRQTQTAQANHRHDSEGPGKWRRPGQ